MEWTAEQRLELIRLLAAKSHNGPEGESIQFLMERIMFLCNMPAEFLEQNKANYKDIIGKKAGIIEL